MTRPQQSLAVVGVGHPNKKGPTRHFGISLLRPGDPVQLVLEPTNKADPSAVAVFTGKNIQIGYLTAERCGWIGGMLRNGREIRAVFQERTIWGAVIRIAFDGATPVLPPAGTPDSQQEDADFWPDPG